MNLKATEALIAKMVVEYGNQPAKNTAKVFSLVSAILFLVGSFGITYNEHLPTVITAIIVILATLAAGIIPIFQGHLTAAKVFSPTTVQEIVGALKNASDAGGAVVGGTKEQTVITNDKFLTGGVPERKVIKI